jgi:predicted transcriptional regulator
MQQNLDLPQDNFRLVRIGTYDARLRTDNYLSLRDYILRSEDAYPNIARWFDSKVSNGLRTGERTGFVGLVNECPVAGAVLKRGSVSKFCHLRIEETARSRSLGDLFFTMMTLEVRDKAKHVRFTLPESVWEGRKSFFSSFSFTHAEKAGRQYRLFDIELFSQTKFSTLFSASQSKLPELCGQLAIGNHSLLTGAVLSVQPQPLEKILNGEKTVEIRTRFSKRWERRRISLYCTHPVSGLSGEATIARVIEGSPDRIWEHFGSAVGCTRVEYEAYVRGHNKINALILSDVTAFPDPIPLAQLTYLLGVNLTAPQSYLSLENNDGWLAAVTLAAALQGSLRIPTQNRRLIQSKRQFHDNSVTSPQSQM